MAKVYLAKVLVVDVEGLPLCDIIGELERSEYMIADVLSLKLREVEWSYDHPLNHRETLNGAVEELFGGDDG